MNSLETLIQPARPSPGPEGLATPLVGLVVLAAVIAWALKPRRRRDWEDEE